MEVGKNMPDQLGRGCIRLESGRVGNPLSTSNFDLWYFFSLLTYKNVQYFIWKIWFISFWKQESKAIAWLLTWVMSAQSNPISYHTEAFVKIEVGCTVNKTDLVKKINTPCEVEAVRLLKILIEAHHIQIFTKSSLSLNLQLLVRHGITTGYHATFYVKFLVLKFHCSNYSINKATMSVRFAPRNFHKRKILADTLNQCMREKSFISPNLVKFVI